MLFPEYERLFSYLDITARKIIIMCILVNIYLFMYRNQNTGRIHSVRIDKSTFERMEEFKYLGTTLTNQNSTAEEIKSRLRSGSACYHSVQNLLSSRLPSKNLKIKIFRTIICLLFCVGVKLGR